MPNGLVNGNGMSTTSKVIGAVVASAAVLWAVLSTVINVHAQQPHKGSVRVEEWLVMRDMNSAEHTAIRREVEIVSKQLSDAAVQVTHLAGKIEQLRAQVAALEARPSNDKNR